MEKTIKVNTVDCRIIEVDVIPPYNFKPTVKNILEDYDIKSGLTILNRRRRFNDPLVLSKGSDIRIVNVEDLCVALENNNIDLMESPCDILIAMNIIDKELLMAVVMKGIRWLRYEHTGKNKFRLSSILYNKQSSGNNRIEISTLDDARDLVKDGVVALYNSEVAKLRGKLNINKVFVYRGVEIEYQSYTLRKVADFTHVKIEFIIDKYGYEVYALSLDVFKSGEYKFKEE